jgi:chitin disaccharide deacetylase
MKYGNVIDPGRDSTRRHIWLCADDYGMSPAVNVAIRDLIVRGRINATSVMVVAPNFNRSEAVSLSILNASETRVAIGLHVTLTAPYQPLNRNFQPVRDGIFLSNRETARHSFLHLLRELWAKVGDGMKG